MFCKKCGKELGDNVRFCSACGEATATEAVAEHVKNLNAESLKEKGKKSRKKRFPWAIIIVVIAILIAGVVLFFVLKESKNKESENTDANVSSNIEDGSGEEKEPEGDESTSDKVDVESIMNQKRGIVAFSEERGNVVCDGEDIYFYEEGFIYHMDGAGSIRALCAVQRDDYRYDRNGIYPLSVGMLLQDGVLYYIDNQTVMAYDLEKGYSECLLEEVWSGFHVDDGFIYYMDAGGVVKYDVEKRTNVETMELSEGWETESIIGKNPNDNEEVLIGEIKSVYEYDASIGDYQYVNTVSNLAYVDVTGEKKSVSLELDCTYLSTQNIATRNYIYVCHTPSSQKGYEEERIYRVPSVITAEDFQAVLDKVGEIAPAYEVYLSDYYIKYDINNWRERDEDKKDDLLQRFPVLKEQVIYVLHSATQNQLKVKFEEILDATGMNEDLMEKSAELDKNPPSEEDKRDFFRLQCINPEDLTVEYSIAQGIYIREILATYENDLIVYAYINDVAGIYRITERSLWKCGLNGEPLQPELLLVVDAELKNMGEYNIYAYPTEEYLYYTLFKTNDYYSLNPSKLMRVKWDVASSSGGNVQGEYLIDGENTEPLAREASVWVDGVEFRTLSYPDNESKLVKVAVDEYVMQMVIPRSIDLTEYRLVDWYSEIWEGQKETCYYFVNSGNEEGIYISFESGEGMEEAFDSYYAWVEEEEDAVSFQTSKGKGYTDQTIEELRYNPFAVGDSQYCCKAMIYDASLQAICGVTLFSDEENMRQQFEKTASEIVFEKTTDNNMLYRASVQDTDYEQRMENMYAKYKEIQKSTDKYLTEVYESQGEFFDDYYIGDLTIDGIPEIIYLGYPYFVCIVGEKNAINCFGNSVIPGGKPDHIFVLLRGDNYTSYTEYQVITDEQGYISLAAVRDYDYLYKSQDVYKCCGSVIDEERYNSLLDELYNCYVPDFILFDSSRNVSRAQFYNSVKRLAPEEIQ